MTGTLNWCSGEFEVTTNLIDIVSFLSYHFQNQNETDRTTLVGNIFQANRHGNTGAAV